MYDSNSSYCPTASDRRGPSGTWRGDLKAHARAKQNVLLNVFCRSVWLDSPSSANAPAFAMPTHLRGLSRIHLRAFLASSMFQSSRFMIQVYSCVHLAGSKYHVTSQTQNPTMSRKTEMYDVTICCACMTRTPPTVRRRLTGGAQVGPSEGILRHTQGQNKTSC